MNPTPSMAAIMPAYNAAAYLEQSLPPLLDAEAGLAEVIVVDDGSTDGTGALAARRGARVLRLDPTAGAAAARNAGARATQGDILVFVDADSVVQPGTLAALRRYLAAHPEADAVFGSYDAEPAARGVVSQYRNLLHHYVHQSARPGAATFWAGLGAVRRAAFERVGGFDPDPRWCAIEDIELGYRLRAAGCAIHACPALQCGHLKRWTLREMVRTDLLLRAVPWTRLNLERRCWPNDLNLRHGRMAGAVLAAALPAAVLAALAGAGAAAWGAAACCGAGCLACHTGFFRFLLRRRGPLFTAQAAALHILHLWCAGLGAGLGWWRHLRGRGGRIRPLHPAPPLA